MSTNVPAAPPRLNVCLVAHFAYGAMAGGQGGHIGGVERQTSMLARWLATRGHRVSLVTWDEGQPDGVEIDGARVLKVCRRDEGIPVVRFVHPRWTSLNAAMRRADADVYYQNCAEYVVGQVALWTRSHRRKFVFSVAGDRDCLPGLPELGTRRERVLYRYGLRHSDRVIAQTRVQQALLRDHFSRDSVVIAMPCPGPGAEFVAPEFPRGRARVLWLGRVTQVKRPDRLLELAAACPELQFDLVGPIADDAREVVERARSVPNVTVHGLAQREEVPGFMKGALCLCSTSDYEGFPNTFLESWSHGVPVVATVDPDGLIASKGLGASGSSVSSLAEGLRILAGSAEKWRAASLASREYYVHNHTVEPVMERFERLFLDVAADRIEDARRHAPRAR